MKLLHILCRPSNNINTQWSYIKDDMKKNNCKQPKGFIPIIKQLDYSRQQQKQLTNLKEKKRKR